MPELPDVVAYLTALEPRVVGKRLERIRLASPFVLRSVDPPASDAAGRTVVGLRRLGKRIVLALDGEIFVVIHLMIAGRLHWRPAGARPPGRVGLAALDFPDGTLTLTEAGTRRRASIHLVRGEPALAAFDPGGLDVLGATPAAFREALSRERHTLKRSLTDPRFLDGIGNAYADEILHRARLSPVRMADQLGDEELGRLLAAARAVLTEWTDRLSAPARQAFPEKVTAFREGMAVHGRYGQPCPVCGAPVQRIVHAENETNYCAVCQTGGRLLADRALSRLLHQDWPRTLEELEERLPGGAARGAAAPRRGRLGAARGDEAAWQWRVRWRSRRVPGVTPLLSVLLLGFFLGMRHATDADHVIAVTTIVSRQRSVRAAAWTGALWGLGHTLTILAVGGAIVLFGLVIPPRVGLGMEFSVALMLILLGILTLTGVTGRLHEAPAGDHRGGGHADHHAHAHSHGDYVHSHVHGHAPDTHGHAEESTPQARLDRALGRFGAYQLLRPLVVGLVHGLAGSGGRRAAGAGGDPRPVVGGRLPPGLRGGDDRRHDAGHRGGRGALRRDRGPLRVAEPPPRHRLGRAEPRLRRLDGVSDRRGRRALRCRPALVARVACPPTARRADVSRTPASG